MQTTLSILLSTFLACGGLLAAQEAPAAKPTQACGGGVVLDDGQVDSGYSFVPSATEGTYVQYFDSKLFPSRHLKSVCVCWLKTRQDRKDVAFEVVFFEKVGLQPAVRPYAWVPGVVGEVAESVAAAGELVEVDVRGVQLPADGAFIGVRWNPSEEQFLFICNDRSEGTDKTEVFFNEDRARGWTDVKKAKDPIFVPHRAIMVRATSLEADAEAPSPWEPPESEVPLPTLTAEPNASSPPRIRPNGE
jgi:hypothetical protein